MDNERTIDFLKIIINLILLSLIFYFCEEMDNLRIFYNPFACNYFVLFNLEQHQNLFDDTYYVS